MANEPNRHYLCRKRPMFSTLKIETGGNDRYDFNFLSHLLGNQHLISSFDGLPAAKDKLYTEGDKDNSGKAF